MYINIKLKQGPIIIKGHSGESIENSAELFDHVIATESFPATRNSAFYFLHLKKEALFSAEVFDIERDLYLNMEKLAHVWHFAGGSILNIGDYTIQSNGLIESNANEIRINLMNKEGINETSRSGLIPMEYTSTYIQPPLKSAVGILNNIQENQDLMRMLKHYYNGRTRQFDWFVQLYMVLDVFKKLFSKANLKKRINQSEISFFEKKLNQLRHDQKDPKINSVDKSKLLRIAYNWIFDYLTARLDLETKKMLPRN